MTRPILYPAVAATRFRTSFHRPSVTLAGVVDTYWITRWDLRGRPPYLVRVLPPPCVNLTVKRGRTRVAGVQRDQFTELLDDRHVVLGVRFLPGGFRGLLGAPVSTITDRFLPVREVFGPAADSLEPAVLAAADDAEMVAILEAFLLPRLPLPDPAVATAAGLVAYVAEHPEITRVSELAERAERSVRALQRLFASYVGVGPKWVIRRYRMNEAADRAATVERTDWATLAAELGYADQAHFTRDFTANVGTSPTRYARADGSEEHAD